MSRLGPELLTLIDERAFVRLVEAFGGTRLFVPVKMTAGHEIAKAIGMEAAIALSTRLAPDYIKVPLGREQRARQYRAEGRSNSAIARALGITETGVETLFRRMDKPPVKGSGIAAGIAEDGEQPDLFR